MSERTQTDKPSSSDHLTAVARVQPKWLTEQAAIAYRESKSPFGTSRKRAQQRQRFARCAAEALCAIELDKFLTDLRWHLWNQSGGTRLDDEGEAVIRQLAEGVKA